jgi:hypothetical protein
MLSRDFKESIESLNDSHYWSTLVSYKVEKVTACEGSRLGGSD